MRANHRRNRRRDPLASAAAVTRVLEKLREAVPDVLPAQRRQLIRMLLAVRGVLVSGSTAESNRGRPPRYERRDLLLVASHLGMILSRESSISVRSFVGQYLPLLDFPQDVLAALESEQINLFESHQLARLNVKKLERTEKEARSLRAEVLSAHLMVRGSGAMLRARVKELLGEVYVVHSAINEEAIGVVKADELLEIDPYDSRALFYEELRRIGRALREVETEDLDEATLEQIIPAIDQLSAVLLGIEQRRTKRRQQAEAALLRASHA